MKYRCWNSHPSTLYDGEPEYEISNSYADKYGRAGMACPCCEATMEPVREEWQTSPLLAEVDPVKDVEDNK